VTSADSGGWLQRNSAGTVDEAGAVLHAWRKATNGRQVDVAAMLGTTQQHLSQMEKGLRPISLEQR